MTRGPAPLSVTFTDLSQNATSRNWDFENDGRIDSTGKTEIHVYTVPGTYTVNLTAVNGNGADSELATITVTEASNDNSEKNETEDNDASGDGGDSGSSSEEAATRAAVEAAVEVEAVDPLSLQETLK
nr:PKD domain-containing protein [Methanosarcina horonobensis]